MGIRWFPTFKKGNYLKYLFLLLLSLALALLAAVHIKQAKIKYSVKKWDTEIRQRNNGNKHKSDRVSEFIQTIWKLWIVSRQLRDKMGVILEVLFELMKVSENILLGQVHVDEGSWITGKWEAGRKRRMWRSGLGRVIAWDMNSLSNAQGDGMVKKGHRHISYLQIALSPLPLPDFSHCVQQAAIRVHAASIPLHKSWLKLQSLGISFAGSSYCCSQPVSNNLWLQGLGTFWNCGETEVFVRCCFSHLYILLFC